MDQSRFDNRYIPVDLAVERLGVRAATLYSYVSRGLVRTIPGSDARSRLYSVADLERLRTRRDARRGHAAVAAAALSFGEPILESSITSIESGGPVYRGKPAQALAEQGASFESVAELLWTGVLNPDARMELAPRRFARARLAALLPDRPRPFDPLLLAVPALAFDDVDRFDTRTVSTLRQGRALLPELASSLALGSGRASKRATGRGGIARTAARALGVRETSRAVGAINRALVLSADHELNASTFAARVAASAGSDLYACLSAALATLSGPRHGGECDRVESLLMEARGARSGQEVVRGRLRRGELICGFGHPLYPEGDPRGRLLLALAGQLAPRRAGVAIALELARVMRRTTGEGPTLDFGLVALANALGAPAGSALALFALGRLAGWIAHVLEQRESGALLRPRARYVERRQVPSGEGTRVEA
ncbi:MAG TPA: citrate synthase [Polyangiaceae bacterium]